MGTSISESKGLEPVECFNKKPPFSPTLAKNSGDDIVCNSFWAVFKCTSSLVYSYSSNKAAEITAAADAS